MYQKIPQSNTTEVDEHERTERNDGFYLKDRESDIDGVGEVK